MTTETLEASLLSVGALFDDVDAKYTIPIYQRNYAWGAEQIEQLISDVHDAMTRRGRQLLSRQPHRHRT